jgi:hypothetical protein
MAVVCPLLRVARQREGSRQNSIERCVSLIRCPLRLVEDEHNLENPTPDAVLARPLSWASYPVATGRPRPGQQRPRARSVADVKGYRGDPRCCFGTTPLVGELPRSNGQTTAWPAAPSRTQCS